MGKRTSIPVNTHRIMGIPEFRNEAKLQKITMYSAKGQALVQRSEHILQVLTHCNKRAEEIDRSLFAAEQTKENKDSAKELVEASVEGILYDTLTLACNLRNQLERIVKGIDQRALVVQKNPSLLAEDLPPWEKTVSIKARQPRKYKEL